MKHYKILIKNGNELVADYYLDFQGDDFSDLRTKVLEYLVLDFKCLGVDAAKKYNLNLLSIDIKETTK
jgi:hypothetical protein